MEDADSRRIESARLTLFADAVVLKTHCNRAALENLEAIRSCLGLDHSSRGESFALMHGSKLVVAAALYGLMDCVILYPELLGLEQDDRFLQSWVFSHKRQVIASGSAFTQPQTEFAKVVTSMHDLMTHL